LRSARARAQDPPHGHRPSEETADPRFTVERYLALVDEGLFAEEDRVELLDGVVVAMAPQDPPQAGITHRVAKVLRRAVGERADLREDKPLVLRCPASR
jgi:Uma2 family endonuclease